MAATPQNVLSQFGFNGGYVDVGWVMTGEPSASRRSRPGPRRLG